MHQNTIWKTKRTPIENMTEARRGHCVPFARGGARRGVDEWSRCHLASREHSNAPGFQQDQRSDVVQIHVVELIRNVVVLAIFSNSRLVDFGRFGQFAIGLQLTGLVRIVLQNDVGFAVLKVAQANEDNIALVYPDLLTKLATNVAQTGLAVKALSLKAAIPKHTKHLRILLAVLFENQFALNFAFVLSSTSIFTTLSFVFRHFSSQTQKLRSSRCVLRP